MVRKVKGDKGDPGDLSKISAQYPLIYDEEEGKLEFDKKKLESVISRLSGIKTHKTLLNT